MAKGSIHSGHRGRLRKKYIDKGPDSFEKHEIIELLLFYALPQSNTNTIGHDLTVRFGSIAAVLEADIEELKKTVGVGDKAAELIKLISDVMKEYGVRRAESGELKLQQSSGMKFARKLFADNPSESRLFMVMLGANDSIISVDLLARGDYTYADVSLRELVFRAIRIDVQRVILVHNHVNGSLLPSDADIRFTRDVEQAFSYIDVEVNDHIIVAGSTAVSMYNDMLKKNPTMV